MLIIPSAPSLTTTRFALMAPPATLRFDEFGERRARRSHREVGRGGSSGRGDIRNDGADTIGGDATPSHDCKITGVLWTERPRTGMNALDRAVAQPGIEQPGGGGTHEPLPGGRLGTNGGRSTRRCGLARMTHGRCGHGRTHERQAQQAERRDRDSGRSVGRPTMAGRRGGAHGGLPSCHAPRPCFHRIRRRRSHKSEPQPPRSDTKTTTGRT